MFHDVREERDGEGVSFLQTFSVQLEEAKKKEKEIKSFPCSKFSDLHSGIARAIWQRGRGS